MAYYAIAIGREQKITQDYNECRRLTNGYPGNKFARFDSFEEAEYFIDRIVSEYEGKSIDDFESSERLVPSFINIRNSINKSLSQVSIYGFIEETVEEETNIFGDKSKLYKNRIKFGALISSNEITYVNWKSNISVDSSFDKNYMVMLDEEFDITKDFNNILIKFTDLVLSECIALGIDCIHILTESKYLAGLLKSNIFRDKFIAGMKIKNSDSIEYLYDKGFKMSQIYVSYYGGRIKPSEFNIINNILKEGA